MPSLHTYKPKPKPSFTVSEKHPQGMSASGFVGPGDIGASLHANSTTWLIDADSGQMVPHFVEVCKVHSFLRRYPTE